MARRLLNPRASRIRGWLCTATLSIAVFAVPAQVFAQEDKAAVAEARTKFRQAISLQTGGNWAGALGMFREVAAVKNTPQVQFNIAICEENLGQLVQALGDYQLAAAQAHEEGKLDVAAEVEGRLETLQKRIPKIIVRRGESAGLAKISVDGMEVGSAMLDRPMPVDPGMHVVDAKSEGYERFQKKVTVQEGAEAEVMVTLTALPESAEEGSPYAGSGDASDSSPEADKKPEKGTNLVPYIVGGAGVLSLAASGVFFLLHKSAASDLEDGCEGTVCDEGLEGTYNNAQLYGLLAPITLGVGVAGVGAGVALLLLDSSSGEGSDSAGVRLAPVAPGAEAGASVLGRF